MNAPSMLTMENPLIMTDKTTNSHFAPSSPVFHTPAILTETLMHRQGSPSKVMTTTTTGSTSCVRRHISTEKTSVDASEDDETVEEIGEEDNCGGGGGNAGGGYRTTHSQANRAQSTTSFMTDAAAATRQFDDEEEEYDACCDTLGETVEGKMSEAEILSFSADAIEELLSEYRSLLLEEHDLQMDVDMHEEYTSAIKHQSDEYHVQDAERAMHLYELRESYSSESTATRRMRVEVEDIEAEMGELQDVLDQRVEIEALHLWLVESAEVLRNEDIPRMKREVHDLREGNVLIQQCLDHALEEQEQRLTQMQESRSEQHDDLLGASPSMGIRRTRSQRRRSMPSSITASKTGATAATALLGSLGVEENEHSPARKGLFGNRPAVRRRSTSMEFNPVSMEHGFRSGDEVRKEKREAPLRRWRWGGGGAGSSAAQ